LGGWKGVLGFGPFWKSVFFLKKIFFLILPLGARGGGGLKILSLDLPPPKRERFFFFVFKDFWGNENRYGAPTGFFF